MKTQVCTICGEDKPANTNYFEKMANNRSGLRYQCRFCKNAARQKARGKVLPGAFFNLDKADKVDGYDTEADLLERELSEELIKMPRGR